MSGLRVVVTGARGQLGRAILELTAGRWTVIELNPPADDIRDWPALSQRIQAARPNLVIHTAAATDVDRCEREPDWAYEVNALGTRHVARAAAAAGADLISISTNYVFDGRLDRPYHEFDVPHPISHYGASKLAGETEALAATPSCWVVRTAMLYAREGRNFVNTMRRLMAERNELSVVADQVGNPTYAPDLAAAIIDLYARAPAGVYHIVNSGTASWHDWACEIARLSGYTTEIKPILAANYRRDAEPPANGALVSLALPHYGITLPDWRDALDRALRP
jgi:dTDP-4-dehydrorhamnose reductase